MPFLKHFCLVSRPLRPYFRAYAFKSVAVDNTSNYVTEADFSAGLPCEEQGHQEILGWSIRGREGNHCGDRIIVATGCKTTKLFDTFKTTNVTAEFQSSILAYDWDVWETRLNLHFINCIYCRSIVPAVFPYSCNFSDFISGMRIHRVCQSVCFMQILESVKMCMRKQAVLSQLLDRHTLLDNWQPCNMQQGLRAFHQIMWPFDNISIQSSKTLLKDSVSIYDTLCCRILEEHAAQAEVPSPGTSNPPPKTFDFGLNRGSDMSCVTPSRTPWHAEHQDYQALFSKSENDHRFGVQIIWYEARTWWLFG